MEISINDISDVEKEINISASADDLAPHIEKAYKKYQHDIEIPGFRKGRAPLDIVKRIHGETIEYKSLDTITNDVYRKIAAERNIQPIGEPVLTDIDYRRGEFLKFSVKYEVKPEIQLKEYKNIKAEKPVHKITDGEVEEELLRMRKSHSTTSPAETVTDDEYFVTADIQQIDEGGNPIIGKKNADARLYLAGGTLYPEIKEGLKNIKTGETRRIKVERERDGRMQTDYIDITAKKIERVVIPDLTDEFIKKITKDKVATVSDFRGQLFQDLENYWKDSGERKVLDAIIGDIVRRHEFTVPESLIRGVLDSLLEDMKNQYPDKTLPKDFNEEAFRESSRGYAISQAKWYLIKEQIIKSENLAVEDADYEQLAEKEAVQFGMEKERLLQFYKSSGSIKERLLNTKLNGFLNRHAIITEKVTEEPV